MREFIADLHIHSCLSACAELDMTPKRIVERAREEGLDIIALTDHNSARNTKVAVEVGRRAGVLVLPGIEVCSAEEAHVLALFGSTDKALRMQEFIYQGLKPLGDDRWQVVVDDEDVVLGFDGLALMGASGLTLAELPERIRTLGGLAVASHIDREAFSVSSQFGFVPDDVIFDAYEVLEPARAKALLTGGPLGDVPWVSSSDAHRLPDVGRRHTVLEMEEASFEELCKAVRGLEGRRMRPRFVRRHKPGHSPGPGPV